MKNTEQVYNNRRNKSKSIANNGIHKSGDNQRKQWATRNDGLRPHPSWHIVLTCYLTFAILIAFGYINEFLTYIGLKRNKAISETNREGYACLYGTWQSFFTRYIYRRVCDAFSQPICSVPAGNVHVLDRKSDDYNLTFRLTGNKTNAINLGSYNYLGFAQNTGSGTDRVLQTVHKYGIGIASTHHELGKLDIHIELEELFARYLGVESVVTFGMGFATNSTNIATFAGKGCLILGDEYNHASLKSGSYISGATYRSFRHNNMNDLETKIRDSIALGDTKSGQKWKKIVIIVEGVYSMEGSIANLPELIRLKKKYKCYLYVDEAHSIGAIGPNGRGITDFYGCDPNDIDLLMGTFTKSFGASGGYIAGPRHVIDRIRAYTQSAYATNMSAPIAQQIISVVKVLIGETDGTDGIERINRLSENTKYFRKRLKEMGFIVLGHPESPVIPILLYFPAMISPFVRLGLNRGIATVGAGYPATTLTTNRIRFCMSSAHNQQMLERALNIISQIGDEFNIKYLKT
ncbi:unnamed protein product [Medioppia subpectinata]|uniref:serine C-palmitoyltransferase n=1 Tax=Medioppia subpectinata TaxID=1979941 RepID=A0A7R9KGY4_9ACAR|nr:unnamed protein product [Medioppia subpectinata]CAG2102135.1 unnamed protein product [Medioppia subpectinata]